MREYIEMLKAKGVKVTSQRVAVLELLSRKDRHYSAEQIFRALQKKFPSISLGTIYATLEALRTKGLINEIQIVPDKASFEARRDQHHHFYCKQCREVFDVDIPFCKSLEERQVDGNLIEECHGYFYGICKQCRKK
ncbi:MAG: Fur family transcriptional regulator [Candidatus Omnitrophota bacterium]